MNKTAPGRTSMEISKLSAYTQRILGGGEITPEEALELLTVNDEDTPLLAAFADKIRQHFCGNSAAIDIVTAKMLSYKRDCTGKCTAPFTLGNSSYFFSPSLYFAESPNTHGRRTGNKSPFHAGLCINGRCRRPYDRRLFDDKRK